MPFYYREIDPTAINQKFPFKLKPVRWYSIRDWIRYINGPA